MGEVDLDMDNESVPGELGVSPTTKPHWGLLVGGVLLTVIGLVACVLNFRMLCEFFANAQTSNYFTFMLVVAPRLLASSLLVLGLAITAISLRTCGHAVLGRCALTAILVALAIWAAIGASYVRGNPLSDLRFAGAVSDAYGTPISLLGSSKEVRGGGAWDRYMVFGWDLEAQDGIQFSVTYDSYWGGPYSSHYALKWWEANQDGILEEVRDSFPETEVFASKDAASHGFANVYEEGNEIFVLVQSPEQFEDAARCLESLQGIGFPRVTDGSKALGKEIVDYGIGGCLVFVSGHEDEYLLYAVFSQHADGFDALYAHGHKDGDPSKVEHPDGHHIDYRQIESLIESGYGSL